MILKMPGTAPPVLTFGHPDQRFAQPSGSLGVYALYASHPLSSFPEVWWPQLGSLASLPSA